MVYASRVRHWHEDNILIVMTRDVLHIILSGGWSGGSEQHALSSLFAYKNNQCTISRLNTSYKTLTQC